MTTAAGMPCPVCHVPLVMSERQGVEIDYCPQCRGVWLDRGELDKLLSAAERDEEVRFRDQDRDRDRYPAGGATGYPRKKKKSFLSELFEGGD